MALFTTQPKDATFDQAQIIKALDAACSEINIQCGPLAAASSKQSRVEQQRKLHALVTSYLKTLAPNDSKNQVTHQAMQNLADLYLKLQQIQDHTVLHMILDNAIILSPIFLAISSLLLVASHGDATLGWIHAIPTMVNNAYLEPFVMLAAGLGVAALTAALLLTSAYVSIQLACRYGDHLETDERHTKWKTEAAEAVVEISKSRYTPFLFREYDKAARSLIGANGVASMPHSDGLSASERIFTL